MIYFISLLLKMRCRETKNETEISFLFRNRIVVLFLELSLFKPRPLGRGETVSRIFMICGILAHENKQKIYFFTFLASCKETLASFKN